MSKLGILFGAFNPLHNGHLDLAKNALQEAGLDSIWFVIQPTNPYKPSVEFFDYATRQFLVAQALQSYPSFKLFQPQTTTYEHFVPATLNEIDASSITLILGQDLAETFTSWTDYHKIVDLADIYISPRLDNISSGNVRQLLADSKPVDQFVPPVVAKYLKQHPPTGFDYPRQ